MLLVAAVNKVMLKIINLRLHRRTKFGNGLFAVLILCLTLSDLAVTFFSILGSLIVEASDLLWGGAAGSCQVGLLTYFNKSVFKDFTKVFVTLAVSMQKCG